jgi:hypothetical protein
MFVFQLSAQKASLEQQAPTKVFTGMDAQRLLKAIGPACEQMLSKVHGKPDAF